MLKNAMVTIIVSAIDVLISVNAVGNEQYNINTFIPEVNNEIKKLSEQYIIDIVLVNGLDELAEKVYNNLIADQEINCPINIIRKKAK